ncbi:hypothetical protein E2C01_006459 [Portunus trituberculatus]|uniref:Uncharacterized protein n=1 Tax=Portunus trituberculatus TaxID=210409 RepID=A0A5B7CXF1_PORTR|nr:hypothetical protein [Portunus trituberculatus]
MNSYLPFNSHYAEHTVLWMKEEPNCAIRGPSAPQPNDRDIKKKSDRMIKKSGEKRMLVEPSRNRDCEATPRLGKGRHLSAGHGYLFFTSLGNIINQL